MDKDYHFKQRIKELGYTVEEFANLVDVPYTTLCRWLRAVPNHPRLLDVAIRYFEKTKKDASNIIGANNE